MSCFVARAVVDECLPPSFLLRVDLGHSDMGNQVLKEAQTLLQQPKAALRLSRVWKKADKSAKPKPVDEGKKQGNPAQNQNHVQEKKEKKGGRRGGNELWISSSRPASFFVRKAISLLHSKDSLELHGLGDAVSSTCEVSQQLGRFGYTAIRKVSTTTFRSSNPHFPISKPEIIIVLNRLRIPKNVSANPKPI